jgi:cell division septal protein FtsQ
MVSPEQIPPVEKWEKDLPSPYRRSDRPVGVRRRQGSTAARLFSVALVNILLPMGFIYGIYLGALNATTSERFQFRTEQNITVNGNHVVPKSRLFEALGFGNFETGSQLNAFRLNLARERQSLEDIPWIKSATVTRIFPGRLVVSIVERTPIAFANVGGHVELVDRDGMFLRMPSKTSFDFPVLYGLDSAANAFQRKDFLDTYSRFMDQTRDEMAQSGWKLSEGDLSDPDDLRILLVRGGETILVHFGDRDFGERFKTFVSVAPRILQNYSKVQSMDLRYHNEVVVDPDMRGKQPVATGR